MSTVKVKVNVGVGGLHPGDIVDLDDGRYVRARLGRHFTLLEETPTESVPAEPDPVVVAVPPTFAGYPTEALEEETPTDE